ncbi:Smr/MutS family protein [Commensalibacter papalotli (ex Servin-Garciduenas et al. 2014)]|uniref:DNA mismatch repair protein Smr n=1 Tax=Commensalibacter papalotli (ex Servin-Garciduenas et al. 2014) TaxID=1208583 RepID=W7DXU6_9PROT|nr:Smr/MutS family protein [Commensalibacter papalotli (ex Servin-Garciduenas et al. 2014)]EUK19033.1 DNA mismatch repair protein Smr [Commensalibacter papalotli (ex Servin-Garciduenas et al. 2014)]
MARGRQLNKEEQSLWDNFANRIKGIRKDTPRETPIAKVAFHERPDNKKKLLANAYRSQRLTQTDSFIQYYKLFKKRQEQPLEHKSFITIGQKQAGLDTNTWKKLHKGQMQPEKILDLHGYTAQRAFFVLEEFLIRAQRNNIRCVEIITGIGTGYKEGGILKRELPYWLNRPAIQSLILGTTYPAQWNGGAVRILLKRNR